MQDAIELPVTRVALFSSGVGCFEHAGEVTGDASVRLGFTPSQLNDVLKSLVVSDLDGGRVAGVAYPSREPVARSLEGFELDVSSEPSLVGLLEQLRGSAVTVHGGEVGSEPVSGTVLGVDQRTRVFGEPRVSVTESVLNLVGAAGIVPVGMEAVERVEIADARLQRELDQALALLAAGRNTERRAVHVRFAGEGTRRVRLAYLVDAAVWKVSYRLELGEADGPASLQGWAIVDNTSDHDWRGVELSLISGQPVSFTQDLYTPLHARRPDVPPALAANVGPRVHDAGMEGAGMLVGAAMDDEMMEMDAASPRKQRRARAAPAPMAMRKAAFGGAAHGTGVEASATGASVGELFRFTLDTPADIDRRGSAMLPVVAGPIDAARLSLFNQQTHATRAQHGVRLTNDTGLKLLAGPVTVFDGGVYAGDALIDHVAPDDHRLLTYAMDLETLIDASAKQGGTTTELRIANGTLVATHRVEEAQTYRVKNNGATARDVWVEHPQRGQHTLTSPEPREKTGDTHRFGVTVPAGETAELVVRETRAQAQHHRLVDAAVVELARWMDGEASTADDATLAALRGVVAQRQAVAALEQQRGQAERDLQAITNDQPRLNENLKSAGRDSPLGKRYLAKLNEQEDAIERLTAERERLNGEIGAAMTTLHATIASL